jgi:3',5'-cyclic AMP phosphodiesterase CpdA
MRIVLVTDTHLSPAARECNENWAAVRAFVARAEADLTIHLGDITMDGAHDRSEFDWALKLSADWPTPLRFLPGNHDIGDNPPGPGLETKEPLDLERLAQYREAFGPDCWRIDADGWRLIGLNAQLFGTDTAAEAEQWDWLEAQLDATRTALLLHKPLFQGGPDDAKPHIRYLPLAPRRRLLALLDRADVPIVLCGHTHQHLDRDFAGRRHVWLPSSSFYIPDSMQDRVGEKVVGIGLLELTTDQCRLDLVGADGLRRHYLADLSFYRQIKASAQRSA